MKRIISMLLVFMMVFALSACGSSETSEMQNNTISNISEEETQGNSMTESNDKTGTAGQQTAEGGKILIAYFSFPLDDGVDTVATASRTKYDDGTLGNTNYISVYVITKYERLNNDGLYDEESIISYSASKSSTKERGFISMAGTLIPMCIFGEIYYSESNGDFRTFLKDCFERRSHEFLDEKFFFKLSDKRITIDIFSGVDTSCAAIDLESKFIESGLARVVIHEKKILVAQFASTDCPFRMSGAGSSVEAVWVLG